MLGHPLQLCRCPITSAIISCLLTFISPMLRALPSGRRRNHTTPFGGPKLRNDRSGSHLGKHRSTGSTFHPPRECFPCVCSCATHGLLLEATQAARITLTFTMTIENPEGKLDIMPGAYLYEIWKYCRRVRLNISSNINEFWGSGAFGTLNGLNCLWRTDQGIPQWLDDYICSIASAPSFFDITAFLNALARHVFDPGRGSTRCSFCVCIPSQTIHAFWLALTHVVHQEMEKVSVVDMDYVACSYRTLTGRISTLHVRERSLFSRSYRPPDSLPSARVLRYYRGRYHRPTI